MAFDSVVIILLDGSRPDVLADLAAAGELPTFKKHFVDAGGFREATSVFPTLSGPAHLPLITGTHPGRANLPGIRWALRPTGKRGVFFRRTRSYMAPFRARKLNRDIPGHIPTIFQHIDGMAEVNTWFVRGCSARSKSSRLSRIPAFFRSLVTADWYRYDAPVESGVISMLESGRPSLSSVFPSVDELGHRFGPMTDESFEAYRRFDVRLQRIIDRLVRLGRLDRTLIVITSDHGQTGTHTHIDLEREVAAVYKRTLAYPLLWRYLFSAEAAVMVSGNAMANVYLTGENGWTELPDFEDERHRAAALVDRLLAHPGIDHVIYRREGDIVVRAASGCLRIGENGEQAVEGEHPFGPDPDRDYPDAVYQLQMFYLSERAGDLVVCAREGYDLRARFEYQPHRGSHGGLSREHMMVPAAVNARWKSHEPIRSVDLMPSMLRALGKPVPEGLDGQAIALEVA